jgi:tetratricopeptide (TPR) repeat protein
MQRNTSTALDALMTQARGAQQRGDLTTAQRLYRMIVRDEPRHCEAYRQLARLAQAKGDVEQATTHLKKAIYHMPDGEIAPLLDMAMLQVAVRDYAGAEKTLRLAVGRDENSAVAMSRLGGVLIHAKRPADAVVALRDALRLAEAKPGAIVLEIKSNLARALLDSGDYEAAIGASEDGLALGGVAVPHLLAIKANAHIRLQDHEAAERTLIEALGHTPEDFGLWVNLGRVRGWLKKHQAAVEAFDRAIRLNPEDPEIVALRINEACRHDTSGALEMCDDYLRTKPYSSAIFAIKGLLLRQIGRGSEADRMIGLDRFLIERELPTPAGFGAHSAFAAALTSELRARTFTPTRNHAPQLGLMTEELNGVRAEPVRMLMKQVEAAAREVCAELRSAAGDHPWVAAMPRRLRTSAWGTLLNSQGHQMSHYHSGAWLNAVYYPSLPKDGMGEAHGEDGWIEFGRPMEHLYCDAEVPVRSVEPREGRVIFFPSYMFHRTKPFVSNGQRISLAFDFIGADDEPPQFSWPVS